MINEAYMVKLQDRVLAPWGPLSIFTVAELVWFKFNSKVELQSLTFCC